jgi:hypothetical protein
MLPHAREDKLVVRELPDEVLVYDLYRHQAHCLNRTAALVWRHCDGHTTVAEMALLLEKELECPADEAMVWLALDRLGRAHLLREPASPSDFAARYTRREVMRKMGMIGAVTLVPMVKSIVAHAAASGGSCLPSNGCVGAVNLCRPCGPPNCTRRCDANGNCSNAVSGC